MPTVRVTADHDAAGFEITVEPLDGLGWFATEPGFRGIAPGQVTKVYIDGQTYWAQRRADRLAFLPD